MCLEASGTQAINTRYRGVAIGTLKAEAAGKYLVALGQAGKVISQIRFVHCFTCQLVMHMQQHAKQSMVAGYGPTSQTKH